MSTLIDYSRCSLHVLEPDVMASAAVRSASALVFLLVAAFPKKTLQDALLLCLPAAWITGWYSREFMKLEFRGLLLEISPPLREATLEQIEWFGYFAGFQVQDAMLGVLKKTCPTVVLAVLCICHVIDGPFIDWLLSQGSVEFKGHSVRLTKKKGGIEFSFDGTELNLRTRDVDFHGLERVALSKSWSVFRGLHPGVTWGDYAGIPIYRGLLSRQKEEVEALNRCYEEEIESKRLIRPSLPSIRSGMSSALFLSASSAATPAPVARSRLPASGSAGSSGGRISAGSQGTGGSRQGSALTFQSPAASQSPAEAALGVIRSSLIKQPETKEWTDKKELFENTWASDSKVQQRFHRHGLTYESVSKFLLWKVDPANSMNVAKCNEAVLCFLTLTYALADTMRAGYRGKHDESVSAAAVIQSTILVYAKRVGVAVAYLCYMGLLELKDEVGSADENAGRVMQALLYLSTNSNVTVLNDLLAHCTLDFFKGL